MKIENTTFDSLPALVLRGEFETDSAAPFLAAVDEACKAEKPYVLVVMRYVKYINSTALGAIVRARSACKERGGDLVVLQPSKLCREVITKMGLTNVLPLFDAPERAIDFFDGRVTDEPGAEPEEAAANEPAPGPSRNTVMFSFSDGRADLIPGRRRRHCVATLANIDPQEIVLRWDPSSVGVAQEKTAEMFVTGSTIHLKTQLKLARREFFEADATVAGVSIDGDDVVVTCKWTNLGDADRRDLEQHGSEMAFLKDQSDRT